MKKHKRLLVIFLSVFLLISLNLSNIFYAAEQDLDTDEEPEYVITCQVEEQPSILRTSSLDKVATYTITEKATGAWAGTVVVNLTYEYTEGVSIALVGYSYSVSQTDGFSISIGTPSISSSGSSVIFRLPMTFTRLSDNWFFTCTLGADCTYYDEFSTYDY